MERLKTNHRAIKRNGKHLHDKNKKRTDTKNVTKQHLKKNEKNCGLTNKKIFEEVSVAYVNRTK